MRLPEDDLPPAFIRDDVSIDVQVDGLKSFAQAVLEDLDKNFGTHVPRVYDVMKVQACVGDGMNFLEMTDAVQRHHECLDAMVNLLQNYAQGTYAMGIGAHAVATNYSDADAAAHVRVRDVQKALMPGSPGGSFSNVDTSTHLSTTGDGLTNAGVE